MEPQGSQAPQAPQAPPPPPAAERRYPEKPPRSLADRLIVVVLLLNLAILAALVIGSLLVYRYLDKKIDSVTGQLNGATEQLRNSSSEVENRLDDVQKRFR